MPPVVALTLDEAARLRSEAAKAAAARGNGTDKAAAAPRVAVRARLNPYRKLSGTSMAT